MSEVILIHMSGPRDGECLHLAAREDTSEITFGRIDKCNVSLPDDPEISRLHARLTWRNQAWWIEDLGSTNGTFKGEFAQEDRIAVPTEILAGEIFRVGRSRFRLELEDKQRAVDGVEAEARMQ